MSKVFWVSIKTRWSSGISSPEYRMALHPWTKDDLDEIEEEFRSNNYWSEHYRGVTLDTDPTVPVKVINERIAHHLSQLDYSTKCLAALHDPSTLMPPISDTSLKD